jgi:drug/metabolite transporter (DMT)-like permease
MHIRPIGIVFMLGACLCAACFRVVSRKAAEKFSAFERTYMMMLLSCVVFTTIAVIRNAGTPDELIRPFLSGEFLISIFFLGALCSVAAYMCVNYAISKLPVAKSAVFSSWTTLISIFAGVILLGEPITLVSAIAAAAIIIGVYQVQK